MALETGDATPRYVVSISANSVAEVYVPADGEGYDRTNDELERVQLRYACRRGSARGRATMTSNS